MERGRRDPADEVPVPTDFGELLGPEAEAAAAELRRAVRILLRRLLSRHPHVSREFEDLVQEVLAICFDRAIKVRAGKAAPLEHRDAWLCRVCQNAILAVYRRRRVQPPADPIPEGFDLPAPRPLSMEERLSVRDALARLDQACRDLLVRRDVLGEDREEMARELGITSNALGVRIHRCRRRLLELYLEEKAA